MSAHDLLAFGHPIEQAGPGQSIHIAPSFAGAFEVLETA